jgi:hypothetical protein
MPGAQVTRAAGSGEADALKAPAASHGTRPMASRAERTVLAALSGFALLARITVALVLPPWQGPDEPKHFEYAGLLVEKRHELWSERRLIRHPGDISPELQAAIIDSMARHDFWTYTNQRPPDRLPASFQEVWGPSSTDLHRTYSPYPHLSGVTL